VTTNIPTFIVDDDPDIRMLIRVLLQAANHGLLVSGEAPTGEQALDDPALRDSSVVILDQSMPGITGIETATRLKAQWPGVRIILCTANLTSELRAQALALGITTCVSKADLETLPELTRALSAA
jgi:DNA-binding NarL/FixJ family response regulator